MFKPATKHDAKLRLAICGPAGAGKTYSLLSLATALGGKIAVVDTEHGSASKYADIFAFDVVEPDTFDPRDLVKAITAAADAGYASIIIDSLSHYWMGKGGELEMVDQAGKRAQGNSFAGWKTVTPHHNALVDTIIAAPIHVLVSMRTKTEWVIEKDDRGKSIPRKIGLAPVMRDGIEFEFDVCGDIDQDNNLTITKSRCSALANQVINRPGEAMAKVLKGWLTGSGPAPARPAPSMQQPNPSDSKPSQPADSKMASGPQADWRERFKAQTDEATRILTEEVMADLLIAGEYGSFSKIPTYEAAIAWWKQFVALPLKAAKERPANEANIERQFPKTHEDLVPEFVGSGGRL
jgi:hypothetical protein